MAESPVPVTVIVSDCAVASPNEPVATPDAFVVTVKLVELRALETPFVVAKYPAPEFVSVNATPLVWTALPNWSWS